MQIIPTDQLTWTLVFALLLGSAGGSMIGHFVSYFLSRRFPQKIMITEKDALAELEKKINGGDNA